MSETVPLASIEATMDEHSLMSGLEDLGRTPLARDPKMDAAIRRAGGTARWVTLTGGSQRSGITDTISHPDQLHRGSRG